MNTLKLLSMFVFALCLLGSVSAVLTYGDWEDSSQTISIMEGDSIDFNTDAISINPPMTLDIVLYDTSYNIIETFENDLVIDNTSHFKTYTLDSSTYSPGYYELVISGSDKVNTDSHTLYLTIQSYTIIDTTAPVITLLGDGVVNVALGDTYTDAGATASDDVDGDITNYIIVGGDVVDTNTVGIYVITYNIQDVAGNSADEVTRTVNVYDPNDTDAPVITVITPEEDKEYDDSELTFEVEVDEIAEVEFSLDGSHRIRMNYVGSLTFEYDVDLSDGDHEVTFYATDFNGNEANITVEFSIDTDNGKDRDSDKTYTNYYQTNYDEELYLDQFKSKKIIYLDEEEPLKKELNWWQKFIAWLKRIFGFN